jgi:N-acetylmuramoyl-L-alanine amidase
MHLSFGWDGIGYHKVICRNGNIENGRPEFWIGAHTFNKNDRSLGVCLIGRNNFSDLQFLSLKNLLIEWKIKYPNSIILGHRDSINTNKTCPNFNVNEWCKKENLL